MKKLSDRVTGASAMLAAMALMPLSDAIAKHLVGDYSAEQVSFMRNAVHAASLLPIVIYLFDWRSIRAALTIAQVLRAICFVLMTFCYVLGLRSTPLAEAMALVFLFPCLVLIGSAVVFGEVVGPARWVATFVGLGGVLLVAGATFSEVGIGVLWILAAAVFTATYVILTKRVAHDTPIFVTGLMPALLGSAMLAIPTATAWTTPTVNAFLLMTLVGMIAATAHLLIVVAYSKADASLIAPIAYSQLIFASLYGYIIFSDKPTSAVWSGMLIIGASGIFLALRERKRSTGAIGRR